MEQAAKRKFASPEEELAFLRSEFAEREQTLLERSKEVDEADLETLGKEVVREYGEQDPELTLTKSHRLDKNSLTESAELVATAENRVEEILAIAAEKGVRNALSVVEKAEDAFLLDEVHRRLVRELHSGSQVAYLDEKKPLFRVLNMTLFEVALPHHPDETKKEATLGGLMSAMEQFYAGMRTLGNAKVPQHYTLEIAVSDKRDDIVFYVGIPTEYVNLFEKQILSLFPAAVLTEQQNDYNVFVDGGVSEVAVAKLKRHPIYPIKTYEHFENDPLSVILNAFSKIERNGGGAAIQLVIEAGAEKHYTSMKGIVKRVAKGEKASDAIRRSTIFGEFSESLKGMFNSNTKDDKSEAYKTPDVDTDLLELFNEKISSTVLSTNLRLVVSAASSGRAEQILTELEASFHQFESTKGNHFKFTRLVGGKKQRGLKAFTFRQFLKEHTAPLSLTEMATLMHFPAEGFESTPQFKQARAQKASAPLDMPEQGTLLGINDFRNQEKEIRLTPEDRLRHFYVIGQTGTGKTVLLKNMLAQDIRDGAGVCMIDPHGTDIEDVLSVIPRERWDDVIYFDPSRTDMVMGLNMLEFDPAHPEQKTFVVNELFSIFQKLYGANPEAMGPIFEQYFRNATQLVLEDPESGSTLLDISRVLADAAYRREKLQKARNPVVVQFWNEIATKAGGEAALENIVPYITSKFDVFTANDYMRPIIGQQASSFDFRDIMDTKKILLVNLSKGRLGEINANLIGMIVVGKILMAALSRVDDPTKSFPPFYLYIDEFQNVTTNSIAAILSEARKYKLGLTVAHQFIAQLDERIRDAVFGNVGSLAAFRVGPEDAQFLEHQFAPVFDANDLMNVENFNAYLRLLANGTPTDPFSMRTLPPEKGEYAHVTELIGHSYRRYGKPRRKVEMEIAARY